MFLPGPGSRVGSPYDGETQLFCWFLKKSQGEKSIHPYKVRFPMKKALIYKAIKLVSYSHETSGLSMVLW